MPLPLSKPAPVVEFDHVDFSFYRTTVLKNISFKIDQGEFVGLIGPNGGGKTTLLKLILGFLEPTQGTIKILGRTNGSPLPIAYVPQSVRYDRDFPISVEEVVASGLLSHLPWHGHFRSSQRLAAQEALERMGLSHLSKASFGTLSGGQAQRVLIARSLVSKPQLLLLDEPTASVDSQAESDIHAILSELKGQMTILMVTHDLRAAIHQVDRILCVQGGIISLKPEEVCEHFALGLYHSPLISTSS